MPTIIGTSAGSDNLVGTTGDDVFQIEGGNDSITGNGGVDTLDFNDAKVGVDVDVTKGTASGWGSQTFTGISNIFGSPGSDTIIGGATTTYISGGTGGNDVIQGGSVAAYIVASPGNDTITGGANVNNEIVPGGGNDVIDGGQGGFNTVDYEFFTMPVGVDLYSSAFHGGTHDTLKNIVNIIGNDAGDTLSGDYQDNIIFGGNGNDSISSLEGNDVIHLGTGTNLVDGGASWDTVVLSGAHSAYTISANAYGWTVTNNTTGVVDTLRNVEQIQFSDGTVALGTPGVTLDATVSTAIETILRVSSVNYNWQQTYDGGIGDSAPAALANYLSEQISTGAMTEAQAVAQVIVDARDTAAVATMSYQFFTGGTPSAAGMDFLIKTGTGSQNPNSLDSSYYQSFNVENRFINFAVALGTGGGAGASQFSSAYGSLTLNAAMDQAYFTIFGEHPTADKINTLLTAQVAPGETRTDYFAFYGGHTDIGTKAAMVGWLLSEAVKADVGDYALSNDAYLTAVATHGASMQINMIGVYDQSGFAFHG